MMEALSLFFLYAMAALFVENAVFTRTLFVERTMLFGSPRRILAHCCLMAAVTFTSSLLSYSVNYMLYDTKVSASIRALIFLLCVTGVYLVFYLLIVRLTRLLPRFMALRRVLPTAAFNCAVLGTLVLATTTQHSLAATAGFGLGAGLGYALAMLLTYAGRRRLELAQVPGAFRGMPIMLLYIGLVSLAIYGLIGHQLPT